MLEVKIKVFQKFFATKIQNPGGSSLTKVLTRDCLSLVMVMVVVVGVVVVMLLVVLVGTVVVWVSVVIVMLSLAENAILRLVALAYHITMAGGVGGGLNVCVV